ncbi:MAG: hypothetical protein RBG13Loki_0736 [Promethearchaeota archaeon CR_4]|nr:MAG: hypothetical protein RBG13Loki_0736 [Candidatus Lokiarchaeota archaeon CR_4]
MHVPKLLPPFETLSGWIGIGVNNTDSESWSKIFKAFIDLKAQFPTISLAIYSKNKANFPKKTPLDVVLKVSDTPATVLLQDLKLGTIQGVVRGSLPSSDFLQCLIKEFSVTSFCRIALLESASGHSFWFAPVGIDEGNSYQARKQIIEESIILLEKCHLTPNIGVLSKGRVGDAKRGGFIMDSLASNQTLVEEIARKYPNISIAHDEILLENVVSQKRNFILAPDGVSGNLIYRTLVHLGQGKAYGAIYCGIPFKNLKIIDTSRVGNLEEIEGAMILALAM